MLFVLTFLLLCRKVLYQVEIFNIPEQFWFWNSQKTYFLPLIRLFFFSVREFMLTGYLKNGERYLLQICYVSQQWGEINIQNFWFGSVCLFIHTSIPKKISWYSDIFQTIESSDLIWYTDVLYAKMITEKVWYRWVSLLVCYVMLVMLVTYELKSAHESSGVNRFHFWIRCAQKKKLKLGWFWWTIIVFVSGAG